MKTIIPKQNITLEKKTIWETKIPANSKLEVKKEDRRGYLVSFGVSEIFLDFQTLNRIEHIIEEE